MKQIWLVLALSSPLFGCTPNAPPPEAPGTPSPPGTSGGTTAPGGAEPSGDGGHCDVQHVFDEATKKCSLFPGGGNGWAGCSMASGPPNNERCVTGTHWEPCDCVCDAQGTRWDADKRACK